MFDGTLSAAEREIMKALQEGATLRYGLLAWTMNGALNQLVSRGYAVKAGEDMQATFTISEQGRSIKF